MHTHTNHPDSWRPSNLNLWFGRYNRNHPLLADDVYRAAKPLGVDWIGVFCELAVKSDSFRNPYPSVSDTVLAWDSQETIHMGPDLLALYEAALRFMREFHKDQSPLPSPAPTPLPAPQPSPEPEKPPTKPTKPSEPTKPNKPGWKRLAATVLSVLTAAGVIVKLFLPAWADAVYDAVIAILKGIVG